MSNELQLFTNGELGKVRMVNIEGKPYAVANDVAKALEYANPSKAIISHCKDDFLLWEVTDSLGRTQETKVISQGNILRLIVKAADQSVNPIIAKKARKFESWIFDEVIPSVLKTGHYETPEYKVLMQLQEQQNLLIEMRQEDKRIIDELSAVIKDSIWSEPITNPRYDFELYNQWYKEKTKDASHRGIFEAVGDYFGIHVPFSNEVKPITLTQWLINKVTLDEIKRFVIGIKKGYIVKNSFNHWVNLNGFGSNNVEFQKVVREFGNKCAYCDDTEAVLIPEHIVSQTEMSSIDPTKVDIINNITCSCGECNGSKGTQDMEEWFRKQPFFSMDKLRKIKRHQIKYEI